MPAAAVIPAPVAYIKVVAVKKLVVGPRARDTSLALLALMSRAFLLANVPLFTECAREPGFLL